MLLSKSSLSLCILIHLTCTAATIATSQPLDPSTTSEQHQYHTDHDTAYWAVCAAVKDHPLNIKEWVEYHAALGVGKFYLMDTDDPDPSPIAKTLLPHIASGLVELYPLPRVNPQTINLLQVRLYDICLNSVRDRHAFIGFWDVDEFIVPIDPTITNIPTFLKQYNYENSGGLVVGWRIVGPSGHIRAPPAGTVLSSFTRCTPWDWPDNQEVKTVAANTKYALHPTSDPHTFEYNKTAMRSPPKDASGNVVSGQKNPLIKEDWKMHRRPPKLALYHYVTKSRQEFVDKVKRGSGMGNRKDVAFFERIEAASGEGCMEAVEACRRFGTIDHCVV